MNNIHRFKGIFFFILVVCLISTLYNTWFVFIKLNNLLRFTLTHLFRSSHRRCSVRKDDRKSFAKLTGKHLCQSLFLSLRPATLLKKRLWHRCFPGNFAKFLRIPFLQNTSWRLLPSKFL